MGIWTYKHQNDGISRLDLLVLKRIWLCCDAYITLRAREALSLDDICAKGFIIILLSKVPHFGPNGCILRAQEELQDFVKLKGISQLCTIFYNQCATLTAVTGTPTPPKDVSHRLSATLSGELP